MPTPPDLSGSAPGFAPPGRLFAGGPVHDHDVSSRTGMPGGASANANGAAAAAAAGWAQAAHSAPVRDGTRSI